MQVLIKSNYFDVLKYLMLFIIISVILFIYYRVLGVHTQFLYCESGWFLDIASYPRGAWDFWRNVLSTKAYNGHYTPLAFGLELLQGYLLGSHENLWLLRQCAAFALMSLCVAIFVRMAGGTKAPTHWLVAASAAVLFLMQPAFLDLVAWPFMVMQVGCIGCGFLALAFLIKYTSEGRDRDAIFSLAFAYGSMQFFGVGAAFSVAMLLAVALTQVLRWSAGSRPSRTLVTALLGFLIVTAAHGSIMIWRSNGSTLPPPKFIFVIGHFGAFVGDILLWGFRSMWMPGGFQIPNQEAFVVDNIYGWCVFALLGATLLYQMQRNQNSSSNQSSVVLFFIYVSLSIYTLMILLRLDGENPAYYGLLIIGDRYIVFNAFFSFCLMVWVLRQLSHSSRLSRLLFPIAAFGAIMANVTFILYQMPQIWPHLTKSSGEIWRGVEDQARLAIDQGQPVPDNNITAGACTMHIHQFEHLLKRGLSIAEPGKLLFSDPK